ncbi:MAG: hypothetical protein QXP49_04695 [Nitrososphaerota archaeon]
MEAVCLAERMLVLLMGRVRSISKVLSPFSRPMLVAQQFPKWPP